MLLHWRPVAGPKMCCLPVDCARVPLCPTPKGTCDSQELFIPLGGAKSFGDDFSALVLGCDNSAARGGSDEQFLSCLRALPTSAIM